METSFHGTAGNAGTEGAWELCRMYRCQIQIDPGMPAIHKKERR
jgi:hypothetical protein